MSHRLRDFDAIDIVARFMRVPPGRWAWSGGLGFGPHERVLPEITTDPAKKEENQGAAPTTNLNASACVCSPVSQLV